MYRAVIAALMVADPAYVPFRPQSPLDAMEEEEEGGEEAFGLGNLFS